MTQPNVGVGTLFGNNEEETVPSKNAAVAALSEALKEEGNAGLSTVEEGNESEGENTGVTAAALETKAPKAPRKLTPEQKAAMKKGQNAAKVERDRAKEENRALWGSLIYPDQTNEEGNPTGMATDLDFKLLSEIQAEARARKKLLGPDAMVKLLLEKKATMPVKQARVNKNVPLATRKAIRTTLRRFNVNPSAARVKAFYNRGNYNTTYKRDKKINQTKKANMNLRKTLLNYFKEKDAKSPELVGLRKDKAVAKANLEEAKLEAEKELKAIAKERRTKAGVLKPKTANPATVKQLAELRQGGYTIKDAADMVRLSSFVKQNNYTGLMNDEKMKALIAQGKKMTSACNRCLLTTIFGVPMD